MADFILTWNPEKTEVNCDDFVKLTAKGAVVPDENWSVGSRTSGIGYGDRAFLLRQRSKRGIVACGSVTSTVYQDQHWEDPERLANYVDLIWNVWLNADDRLQVEELKQQVPGVHWDHLQGSGVKVPDDAAAPLDRLWESHLRNLGRQPPRLAFQEIADEVLPSASYREGAVSRISVNRYERDPRARADAIALHGLDCVVCGFNFEAVYGPELGGMYVHIHHLRELSRLPPRYRVDPARDLVPVCANCHAMLHRRRPALTPEELRRHLENRGLLPARNVLATPRVSQRSRPR